MTQSLHSKTPSTLLYKILTNSEFSALPLPPTTYYGTSFDLSSSPPSHHICSSLQIPSTISLIFAQEKNLWILALPRTERLEKHLIWDSLNENGMEMCGRLVMPEGEGIDVWGEVAVRRPVERDEEGNWDLGELEY